jgi:hypothetical protein
MAVAKMALIENRFLTQFPAVPEAAFAKNGSSYSR